MRLPACLNRTFTLGQCLIWLWVTLLLMVLGAHFYRAGEDGIVLCVVGIIVFQCSAKAWKRYVAGLFLLCGMLEWLSSACTLYEMRVMLGLPWLRGTTILAAVALVTGLTGAMAVQRAKEMIPQQDSENTVLRATVFMAVFLSLFLLRKFVPLQLLLLERFLPVIGSVQIFFAACYGAFAVGLLADRRYSRRARFWLWLTFGLIFFAQFALGLLGMEKMLLTGQLHVPVPAFVLYGAVFRETLNAMPFIVLATTLLAGGAWCSLFCYFGTFDALAGNSQPLRPLPVWLVWMLRYGRLAVLLTAIPIVLLLRWAGCNMAGAVSLAVAYAIASLFFMVTVSRKYGGLLHCGTVCPLGLIVRWLGRLAPWRLQVDVSRCDNCGVCEKICRWRAITPASRAMGNSLPDCTLCRDCLSGCSRGALYLRCPGLSPMLANSVFTGLIAALHAIFLSVAMV